MKFIATKESVISHDVPKWYHDCKLGIFIHWGLYSVPCFAPPSAQLGEVELDERWYANNPYAEWYLNSIRIHKGPSYEYHKKTYGENYDYNQFVNDFTCENYCPREWVELFKKVHAGYVVLTTKHHDGYCLWDSKFTDFNSKKIGPKKDLLKELSEEIKKSNIKMGVYYSGIIDWQYSTKPMISAFDVDHPDNITYAYSDYAFNQMKELIDLYKPSILWNDIAWPYKGREDLPYLLSHYYNTCEDGVINDRWNHEYKDYSTKEYKHGEVSIKEKWEMTRGLGLSFGYNANEDESHMISKKELIRLLIETVANNGNLLINIGPKKDGSLCDKQVERLLALGAWLDKNGESIFNTRPYKKQKVCIRDQATLFYTDKGNLYYILITDIESKVLSFSFEGKEARLLDDTLADLKYNNATCTIILKKPISEIAAIVIEVKK